MRRYLCVMLFLVSGLAFGNSSVPESTVVPHSDPGTQREFQNTYQAIRNPQISTGTAQNFTVTNLTIASGGVVNGLSVTGRIVKKVTANSNSSTTTTSGTYQSTNLTASIAMLSATDYIRITAVGVFSGDNLGATDGAATVFRGSTDLSPVNMAKIVTDGNGQQREPCTLVGTDSPGTTSSTAYTVKIKVDAGAANTVGWGQVGTQYMLLEEISN